jgi:type I restriction enzyme, S subunit
MEARSTVLGEVVRFGNGKSIRPGGDGTYPVYGSNGIIGGSDEFRYQNGVIIGRVGAYCGSVAYCPGRFWASDNTLVAFPATNQIDTKFLFYLLVDANLSRYAGGAAQPLVTQAVLKQVHVRIPSLREQKRIAGILSAYDELTENNQRRIRILEEMARALYREWFVELRFPGYQKLPRVASALGRVPKGWEAKPVKEAADVTYGFPFQSDNFNTDGIGTPVIRIRDVPRGFSQTFTSDDADLKYHVSNGDILVGMDGDFHMCIWSGGHAFQNQRVARFESRGEIGNYHLFLALEKPIQGFNKTIVGTTVAHLGDMHIKTIQILWPPAELRAKARDALEPMSQAVITLKSQIRSLHRTRDLLLPRLLSGKCKLAKEGLISANGPVSAKAETRALGKKPLAA